MNVPDELSTDPVERLTALLADPALAGVTVVHVADGDTVATRSDLAREFRVGRTAVHQWVERRERNGFPEPLTTTAAGDELYSLAEIRTWRLTYVPGNGAVGPARVVVTRQAG